MYLLNALLSGKSNYVGEKMCEENKGARPNVRKTRPKKRKKRVACGNYHENTTPELFAQLLVLTKHGRERVELPPLITLFAK